MVARASPARGGGWSVAHGWALEIGGEAPDRNLHEPHDEQHLGDEGEDRQAHGVAQYQELSHGIEAVTGASGDYEAAEHTGQDGGPEEQDAEAQKVEHEVASPMSQRFSNEAIEDMVGGAQA